MTFANPIYRIFSCKYKQLCIVVFTFCLCTIGYFNASLIERNFERLISFDDEQNNFKDTRNDSSIIVSTFFEPKLNKQQFKIEPYNGYKHWLKPKYMPRGFTIKKHREIMGLLELLDAQLKLNNITYMLSDGSLLGSWRHHDLIPWDDDLDILVDQNDKEKLEKLLQNLQTGEILSGRRWDPVKEFEYFKVFSPNSSYAGNFEWRWPFIDILFYNQTDQYLTYEKEFEVPLEYVFPLRLRPFGHLFVPTPADPIGFLNSIQIHDADDVCLRSLWNHRYETLQTKIAMQCKRLRNVYPFVIRDCDSNEMFCEEILSIGNKTLQKFKYPKK